MARRPFQAGPSPGSLEDLVDPIGGHRPSPVAALQRDEHPICPRVSWPFVAEVVANSSEECVGDRDHSLVAALALGDEQRPLRHLDVAEGQAEDLAAAQPAQHHRVDHRPVAMCTQRTQQRGHLAGREDLRERARHAHQRHLPTPASTATGRQATRDRVRGDRRVSPGDQVCVEAGDRREPSSDRARRQARLAVPDPNHGAVATLVGDEGEHVRRHHLDGILVDDGEQHLQVMGHRPQRVRPGPPSHERQVRVDKRITQRIAGLPTRGRSSDQARELVHPRMLPAPCRRHGDAR